MFSAEHYLDSTTLYRSFLLPSRPFMWVCRGWASMGRRGAFGRIFVRQVDAGLGLGISFTILPVIVGASNPRVPALLSGLFCRNSSEPLAPLGDLDS